MLAYLMYKYLNFLVGLKKCFVPAEVRWARNYQYDPDPDQIISKSDTALHAVGDLK
jgi:hypothetical protein